MMRLDPVDRSMIYASAGQRGYLFGDGLETSILDSTSLPLGVRPDTTVPTAPAIALRPGNLVTFFTDGVTEAMDENKVLFSDARLLGELKLLEGLAVQEVMKADLGLSDTQTGTIQTVFLMSIALCSLPIAFAADRWSRHRIIVGTQSVAMLLAFALAACLSAALASGPPWQRCTAGPPLRTPRQGPRCAYRPGCRHVPAGARTLPRRLSARRPLRGVGAGAARRGAAGARWRRGCCASMAA